MRCKHCGKKVEHSSNGPGFANGAMLGGLLGAALGMLYAPAPGEETRKKLKTIADDVSEKSKEVADEAKFVAEEVKAATSPLIDEVEKNMGPILKKAKESGKETQFEVMEKIEQLVEDANETAGDAGKSMKKFFKGAKKR